MKRTAAMICAISLILSAFSGCMQAAEPYYPETESSFSETETASVEETSVTEEFTSETETSPTTVTTTTVTVSEDTFPSSSEDTEDAEITDDTDVSDDNGTEAVPSDTEDTASSETAASEIIDESESREILAESSETTVTTVVTSAASSEMTTLPPAPVVIPQVYTGSFNRSSVLENDLACVDISDTRNGVIQVSYKGSCGKVKVRVTKGSSVYDYSLDKGGSVFPLQSGSGSYNIKVLENVEGKTYAIALDMDFPVSLADEFRPYLMPTQYINYNGSSNCVKKAAELCAGKNGTVDKLSSMFGYITSNISYDKALAASVVSGYVPDPDKTLAKGTGICFDYASLFASMCRSQGIPARLVMGYVRGDVYHAWNEVYTPETGWVTADLFLGKKGWELLDPTFYASADNKDEVSKYIGSGTDYSAVYYY